MSVLRRKLARDVRRQKAQFIAVAVTIAIGVAVYGGATDAYRNLRGSFESLYDRLQLPDALADGADPVAVTSALDPRRTGAVVASRHQADVAFRIGDHQLLGRAVGDAAPAGSLSQLLLTDGRRATAPDEVVVEHHLADWFDLRPGSRLELLTPSGWQWFRVSGVAVSSEYLWPARSQQELLTNPEQFGVVFAPDATVRQVAPAAVLQTLVRAEDRDRVGATVAAFTRAATAAGATSVTRRAELPSVKAIEDDVSGVAEFAALLPMLFLAAAVFGCYLLLSRLVRAQRSTIGTLLACGESRRTVVRHYLGYGLVCGAAGTAVGVVGGVFIGRWFATAYAGALGIPVTVTRFHPWTMVTGVAVGIGAALVASWFPARSAARTPPAEAMRALAPPIRGSVSLAERVLPPLCRLPIRWRMAMRNLGRNPRRSAFTVAGVVLALSLVVTFAGLRDTVAGVLDRQFGQLQSQDAEAVGIDGDLPVRDIAAVRGVAAAEPAARHDAVVLKGDRTARTLLTAQLPDTRFHRFTNAEGGSVVLPSDGVLVSRQLAEQLGAGPGDTVTIRAGTFGFTDRIAAVVDEPLGALAYTSIDNLRRRAPDAPLNSALLRLRPGTGADDVRRPLTTLPGVAAVIDTASLETTMRDAFALYDTLVGMMLLFGALMAFALLYNSMSANTAERTVELGTLEAAGFGPRQLRRLVVAENLTLTVTAIPLGVLAGYGLARYLMSTFETQGQTFALEISGRTLLLCVAVVLGAAVVAQLPAARAVRRIDIARIVRERST